MKREDTDFFVVHSHHLEIHGELVNWGLVVRVGKNIFAPCAPIFKLYRTDPHYTDEPSSHLPKRPLAGFDMETRVRDLPHKNREALRWMYVHWETKAYENRQELGVTARGLMQLIHDGRSMLLNRGYKFHVDRRPKAVAESREI